MAAQKQYRNPLEVGDTVREERWHSCECGCSLDRDHNAAINILALGKKQLARMKPTPQGVEAS